MRPMLARWGVYQSERFPLVRHAPLVVVTVLCALMFTLGLQNEPRFPSLSAWFFSSLVTLGLFFQLRVLDEFKDFKDDSQFRPYRPVPRGVLKLSNLAVAGWIVAALQVVLTFAFAPRAIWTLFICWAFMALMAAEFFVPTWLQARPLLYMLSHAPITGLIQINISAWLWTSTMPLEVIWLALSATAAGMILEIGRKIRAPEDEERGVNTYTAAWGRPRAVAAWITAAGVAATLTLVSSFGLVSIIGLTFVSVSSLWLALRFLRDPSRRFSKLFEPISAIWALVVFVSFAMRGWL
jgi:UbiA prenyltransferase family